MSTIDDPIEWWRKTSSKSSQFKVRQSIFLGFCKYCDKTPEQLLQIARKVPQGEPQQELIDMAVNFLDDRLSKGLASSTISSYAGAICGFFKANYVTLRLPKKFWTIGSTYEIRRLPHKVLQQREVQRMIQTQKDTQSKALIAFLAQTG